MFFEVSSLIGSKYYTSWQLQGYRCLYEHGEGGSSIGGINVCDTESERERERERERFIR
jgi:hypothetical protein